MSIWISWVEVEGVLDILLFCTIDLTFPPPPIYFLVSVFFFFFFKKLSTDSSSSSSFSSSRFFSSREGEAADVSELAAIIMATAASLFQHTALQTGAPGFYTTVKTAA